MRLVIVWPERSNTRLIPALTETIDVTVRGGDPNTVVARAAATRPVTGNRSETVFNALPTGDVSIEVNAVPGKNDVSMNLLALGSTTATVRAGETTEADIVMGSTIARLVVSPNYTQLRAALNYPQSVRVENAEGGVVLTLPTNIVWLSDNESVVTVDSSGTLVARTAGTARITVRESESGVEASYNVEVLPADPTNQIAPAYEITEMRTIPANRQMGEVVSVNDNGQVVGWLLDGTSTTGDARRAFLWQNGSYTMLGLPPDQIYSVAFDINNRGQVVGGGRGQGPAVTVGWIWESGTFTTIPMPSVPFPLQYIHAQAINESGEVVGHASNYGYFRRSPDGVITSIRNRPGPSSNVPHYMDINESGDVVGIPLDAPPPSVWRRSGETVSFLPPYSFSEAYAITDAGSIVGFSNFISSGFQGALWNPGTGAISLFPGGGQESSLATDANNGKLIVGYRGTGDAARAFIVKQGETPVLLNDRLPANSGWVLLRATSINQNGQVVGVGRRFGGPLRGFILSPKF